MLRSKLRLLTTALTATAIFGAATSVAIAGGDLMIKKQAPNVRPPAVEQTAEPGFTAKFPVIFVPDLRIENYAVLGGPGEQVTVSVKNAGKVDVGPSALHLTVTIIDGMSVKRTVFINLPGISANAEHSTTFPTSAVLGDGVAIADTTFRIDADATDTVFEINEANNTVWHNL